MTTLEQRVLKLEELAAHQQHFLQLLDKAVLEARSELDQFRRHTVAQNKRLASLLDSHSPPEDPLDEKPPHY